MGVEDKLALVFAFCLNDVFLPGEIEHLGKDVWEKDVLRKYSKKIEPKVLMEEWKQLREIYHENESECLEFLDEIGDPLVYIWTDEGEWLYRDIFEHFCDVIGHYPEDWDSINGKFGQD